MNYSIQIWPRNPILRKKSLPISEITEEILLFSDILLAMMEEYDWVWLAAPQIGENIQMIAITEWVTGKKKDRCVGEKILINPRIIEKSKETSVGEEGCVSLPKVFGSVRRHKKITVEYIDITGKKCIKKYSDFTAAILQHEIDHLSWILFIDKMIEK